MGNTTLRKFEEREKKLGVGNKEGLKEMGGNAF